jgi:hypothetical protein
MSSGQSVPSARKGVNVARTVLLPIDHVWQSHPTRILEYDRCIMLSPQPMRLGPEWSSPIVLVTILVFVAAFVLYLYLL